MKFHEKFHENILSILLKNKMNKNKEKINLSFVRVKKLDPRS